MLKTIKVHAVTQGPHQNPDCDTDEWVVVAMVELDGQLLHDYEIYCDSLEDLYIVEKWCQTNVAPYIMEIEDAE